MQQVTPMQWDRLFRSLVLGGAALTGGITVVSCSDDTMSLTEPADASDAGPRDVPREGPDVGTPSDTGPRDVPREGPDVGPLDSGVEDAEPADVPREGPDV